MGNKSSEKYYDKLQPQYRSLSEKKAKYLNAVDKYIENSIKTERQSSVDWIDIGCGDGNRTKALHKKMNNINILDCIEESSEMADVATKTLEGIYRNLFNYAAENAPIDSNRYDLATCLWNVIGHAKDKQEFVNTIYKFLKEDGVLFLDANNRFNISEYGILRVLRNILLNFLGIANGLFELSFKGERTEVYIFEAKELTKILLNAGFKDIEVIYFNYRTGVKTGWMRGQIIIQAYKRNGSC